jgi:hypothetical protein
VFSSGCQPLITELRIAGYHTQSLLRKLQLGPWNEFCLTFLHVPANQGSIMRYVWLQGGVLPRLADDSAGQASRIALLIKMYEICIIRLKDMLRKPLRQRRYFARAEL